MHFRTSFDLMPLLTERNPIVLRHKKKKRKQIYIHISVAHFQICEEWIWYLQHSIGLIMVESFDLSFKWILV